MRTSQRHHLKENELALAVGQANLWAARNKRTLVMAATIVALVVVAALAIVAWRNRVDANARALLAEAMVVQEAPVVPPVTQTDPATPPPAPQPGSYGSERAKLETALPKFMAAADAYPSSDAGKTARYHAAAALVGLGRYHEAIQQYDRVINDASGLLSQMARLGKAEAQLRAGQHDAAIASFTDLSNRTDSSVPKEALLLELARAYKAAGKSEDARKTLNQIVEQHAQSPFAAEARQELEKIQG